MFSVVICGNQGEEEEANVIFVNSELKGWFGLLSLNSAIANNEPNFTNAHGTRSLT